MAYIQETDKKNYDVVMLMQLHTNHNWPSTSESRLTDVIRKLNIKSSQKFQSQ